MMKRGMIILLLLSRASGALAMKEDGRSRSVFSVYKKRLVDLYRVYSPNKVEKAALFLRRNEGEEHEFYLDVCRRLNVKPYKEYRISQQNLPPKLPNDDDDDDDIEEEEEEEDFMGLDEGNVGVGESLDDLDDEFCGNDGDEADGGCAWDGT